MWRKFSVMFMGFLDSALFEERREGFESILKGPIGIMTPWGFFLIIIVINLAVIFFLDLVLSALISRIREKETKSLFEMIMKFFTDKTDPVKAKIITKEPLSEYDKYLYFKYAEKGARLRFRGSDTDDEDYPLKELRDLRDEAYENYLILRLSGVE